MSNSYADVRDTYAIVSQKWRLSRSIHVCSRKLHGPLTHKTSIYCRCVTYILRIPRKNNAYYVWITYENKWRTLDLRWDHARFPKDLRMEARSIILTVSICFAAEKCTSLSTSLFFQDKETCTSNAKMSYYAMEWKKNQTCDLWQIDVGAQKWYVGIANSMSVNTGRQDLQRLPETLLSACFKSAHCSLTSCWTTANWYKSGAGPLLTCICMRY